MTDLSSSRRRFLTMASSAALVAGLPWPARADLSGLSAMQLAPKGAKIASVRIYPAIGICRVGGSEKWFYAPEIPGLPADPGPDGFKDGANKIKKQAQRFRLYSFDEEGRIIGEVTGEKINWQVHLANTKGAWYGFNNPLDNGALAPGLPGQKRNQYFASDAAREENLIIDGGSISITGGGTNSNGDQTAYAFEGTFFGGQPEATKVGLGQLRTDAQGRLIVMPPSGVSKSPTNAPITSFADNDGWHDDWCDGPVTASVEINGVVLTAEAAWVACVGPNFAPEIPPVTTLYDLIEDMNIDQGWEAQPKGPISFMDHIYPIFRRLALMEWVTQAAHLRQGWMDIGDLSDPNYINKIADSSPKNLDFRKKIFKMFRNPNNLGDTAYLEEQLKFPYMLGDGVNYDGSPLQWFQFTKMQYAYLTAWANGQFINDFDVQPAEARRAKITQIDEIDLALQPGTLTKAALEPCSGGAFHPGVELGYYLRLPQLYARNYHPDAEPFRIAHGSRKNFVQDVGRLLDYTAATKGLGKTPAPLGPQMAGDMTRWMGLPWQCDAFSCQQVLLQEDYPTAVWWPALLPIDVLPEKYYEVAQRADIDDAERSKFMSSRVAWSRAVSGIGYHANASYWDGLTNMISVWERMGFVVRKPTLNGYAFVEIGNAGDFETRFDWKPTDGMLPN